MARKSHAAAWRPKAACATIKYYASSAVMLTSPGEYTTRACTRTHIDNMRCSEMHPRTGRVATRVRAERSNSGSIAVCHAQGWPMCHATLSHTGVVTQCRPIRMLPAAHTVAPHKQATNHHPSVQSSQVPAAQEATRALPGGPAVLNAVQPAQHSTTQHRAAPDCSAACSPTSPVCKRLSSQQQLYEVGPHIGDL